MILSTYRRSPLKVKPQPGAVTFSSINVRPQAHKGNILCTISLNNNTTQYTQYSLIHLCSGHTVKKLYTVVHTNTQSKTGLYKVNAWILNETFLFPKGITLCLVYCTFNRIYFPTFNTIQGLWQIVIMLWSWVYLCLINIDLSPGFMYWQSNFSSKLATTWWLNLTRARRVYQWSSCLSSRFILHRLQLVLNSHLQHFLYALDQLLQKTKRQKKRN